MYLPALGGPGGPGGLVSRIYMFIFLSVTFWGVLYPSCMAYWGGGKREEGCHVEPCISIPTSHKPAALCVTNVISITGICILYYLHVVIAQVVGGWWVIDYHSEDFSGNALEGRSAVVFLGWGGYQ